MQKLTPQKILTQQKMVLSLLLSTVLAHNNAHAMYPIEYDQTVSNALVEAAIEGNAPLVRTLLQGRANPNATVHYDNGLSSNAFDPALACMDGSTIQLFLDSKVDPDRHSLQDAMGRSSTAILQMLLDAKVDPNTPDHKGALPLHYAINNYHFSSVTSLLHAGADKELHNAKGQTAVECAREKKKNIEDGLAVMQPLRRPADYAVCQNHLININRIISLLEQSEEEQKQ